MAVLARTPDHARALPAAEKRTSCRLAVPVEGAVVTDRQVVALLAEIRSRGDQQLVVVGSVRLMTVRAIFANRRVLPQHRPALLGVTRVTDVVDGIGDEERSRRRAMPTTLDSAT